MNSFGLGLVLNFTDNASAGMRRVSQTFNEMNSLADRMVDSSNSAGFAVATMAAAGAGLTVVGENMTQAGTAITNLFTGLTKSVIDTGGTMLGFRSQLKALYGEDSYEQKMQEIKQYAKDSVFEVEGLMSAVTVMKAVGIEAMDEVTTSSGKTTQKLLDYASDIAAMVPNMRNSYGTGVEAAMGALKEYVAEGNALSLKRGAGFDIEEILGESKGATIEERTRQVADLVEKLGIAGYTASLAGTPTQQLAKIQDTLFNVMSDISDSGVYEKYTQLLTKAATWIETLTGDTERYNTLVSIVGDTITTLMTPIEKLLDMVMKLADAFIKFAETNPNLAKGILIAVAALGAFLVVGGQALKLAGSFFLLTSGLMQMRLLAEGGVSAFNIFGRAISMVITKALPFVALAGLLYLVWSNNMFGIRDVVTKVFTDLGTIFSLVSEAWSDNTLSVESFRKAADLGILPLIEALLQLKYYWGFVVDGFKNGFKSFIDGITDAINSFGMFDIDITKVVASLGEFLRSLIDIGAEDKWTKIGEVLGKIAGVAAIVAVLIKPVMTIVSVLTKVFGVVGRVISFIGRLGPVFRAVGTVFSTVGGVIMSVLTAVAGALGISVGWVIAIIAAVVAIAVAVVKNWDTIKSFLSQVPGWVQAHIIEPVKQFFQRLRDGIVTVAIGIKEGFCNAISTIAEWVNSNIIQPVVEFFSSLIGSIVGIASSIFSGFCSILASLAGWVNSNVIQPIIAFFQSLVGGVSSAVSGVYGAITGAFSSAYSTVTGLWSGITGFFSGLFSKVSSWVSRISAKGSSLTDAQARNMTPHAANGIRNFVGGLIQVNEQGGELITLPSGSTVIPHDQSIRDSLEKGILMGSSALAMYAKDSSPAPAQNSEAKYDYSVTFSAGSIVIQLANSTEAELEKAAEKLMKIIERKQQLKSMAVRA